MNPVGEAFPRFITFSILFAALLGLIAGFGFVSYEKLVFFNVWLLSVPHTFSTFFRHDLRTPKKGMFAIFAFFLFLGILTAVSSKVDLGIFIAVYFFAQQIHYARQNYGIARILEAGRDRSRLESLFYPSVALISVLGAVSKGPINFFGFAVKNPLPFLVSEPVTAVLLSVILGAFLLNRSRDRWPPALMHFGMNAAIFLFSQHFTLVWFVINVLHNLQYLQLMVRTERSARILVFPYILSLALALFSGLPGMILVFLSLNFTHYLWDSRIWRGVRVS
ncbi:MAG: hypothetical protein KGP28_03830 [Bdellovibrionales bacterium]|nr:hypothetical protein [Bdellovibrionales bacterium]